MNLLIVDDQQNIIDGLKKGIEWIELGIHRVYEANNAMDAKDLIQNTNIGLILCDIEMPMESGIELIDWIHKNNFDIKCILLTAHADFNYAQSAIRLGVFEYILQPAPYDEIKQVVVRALQNIEGEMEKDVIYNFGKYWRKEENIILDVVLQPFLTKRNQDHRPVLKKLSQMNYDINENSLITPILIQTLGKRTQKTEWETELLRFSFENILREIYKADAKNLLSTQFDSANFCILICENSEKESLRTPVDHDRALTLFLSFCKEKLFMENSCYLGDSKKIEELSSEVKLLYDMELNNVVYKNVVYRKGVTTKVSFDSVTFHFDNWKKMLEQGCYQAVKREVVTYLFDLEKRNHLSVKILEKFYQQFIQMFFEEIAVKKIKVDDFFVEDVIFENYIHAHNSLDDMIQFINYTMNFLENMLDNNSSMTYIERAKEYISKHIEDEISRSKLAEMLYISPEYLSRLFKKEEKITFNDYVVGEKMKIAYGYIIGTNYSISDISVMIGYTNFSYFSQVFKRIYKVSPMMLRKTKELNCIKNK